MDNTQLYFVTGKGGVGKSVTALALANNLKKTTNKKIYLNSFDSKVDEALCKYFDITPLQLSVENSAVEYIGRKLKSQTIARWILKTPFFNALFNIVPSLSNMILLGHLIDLLEKNKDSIVVVDAPSSGHILTILESHLNFERIFKTGLITKDIERMKNFIENPMLVQTFIVSIPTELSMVEGLELKNELKKTGLKNIKQILNNMITLSFKSDQMNEFPDFLKNKISSEKEILSNHAEHYDLSVPMYLSIDNKEIIQNISNIITKVVSND